jgi:branched-chain amino acid transport system substrate-binding protein
MKRHLAGFACILCLLCSACVPVQARKDGFFSLVSTRPVIKIGLVAPFEGRYRALGYEVLYAVKLAVRQRNEAGGIAGYMVELVALNDQDDPGTSEVQAHKFAVDQQVMGVVGPFSDAAALAAAPAYRAHSLGVVTPSACFPALLAAGDREVFCAAASLDDLAEALRDRVPAGSQAILVRAEGDLLGDRLAGAVEREIDASEVPSALDAVRATRADLLLYGGDVLSAADLLVRLRAAGIDAPFWGGPSLARTQLVQIAGDAVGGACYAMAAPLFADLAPEGALAAQYRDLAGAMPGPWAGLAYDAAELLLNALSEAIEAEGRPTREGVIAHLEDARGPDGLPLFTGHERREGNVSLYCYGPGEGYPGHLAGPAESASGVP